MSQEFVWRQINDRSIRTFTGHTGMSPGSPFPRWPHRAFRQLGQDAETLGPCHRQGASHLHGTYSRGHLGRHLPRWPHRAFRQRGQHAETLGPCHRQGASHLHGTYWPGPLDRHLPRWPHRAFRQRGQDAETLGPCHRQGASHLHGTYWLGLFGSHFPRWPHRAFRRDSRTIRPRTLKLWDVATGKELRTFTGHTGWVHSVAIPPMAAPRFLAAGTTR